jgi:hypothetical protein
MTQKARNFCRDIQRVLTQTLLSDYGNVSHVGRSGRVALLRPWYQDKSDREEYIPALQEGAGSPSAKIGMSVTAGRRDPTSNLNILPKMEFSVITMELRG